MVLKGILAVFWLAALPFLLGSLLQNCCMKKNPTAVSCVVYGYLGMFASFEIVFVPLILLRSSFSTAVCVMAAVWLVLAVFAAVRCQKQMRRTIGEGLRNMFCQPLTIYIAVLLVLIQAFMYAFFMVTDLDDTFYVATATTAVQYDTMFVNSPYTGELMTSLSPRYVLSPLPMLVAFLSKCTGFHAAVIAHTVLPVFLVVLAYLVYYLCGECFFAGKRSENGLFLILLSLIHISSYYSVYTQGTFLLVRIWQGKAVLAAILLPMLFLLCFKVLASDNEKENGVLLLLTVLSCCMVSSMGIALAPVMMAVFLLLFGFRKKNLKQTVGIMFCCLPCVVLGIVYLILTKVQ